MSNVKRRFFSDIFARYEKARMAQARRYVNGVLLALDDATLETYGYSREELKKQGSNSLF
ncbi:hypothetical protein [Coralliovum pocilloporae]|uniref:hypothetical protein n=1 Tax=Coralliovum pocilloporae TaxID=3066369 RepID=UPI0033074052